MYLQIIVANVKGGWYSAGPQKSVCCSLLSLEFLNQLLTATAYRLSQSTTNTGPSICQHVITYWPIVGCPHWASKKVQTLPTMAQHHRPAPVPRRMTVRGHCRWPCLAYMKLADLASTWVTYKPVRIDSQIHYTLRIILIISVISLKHWTTFYNQ